MSEINKENKFCYEFDKEYKTERVIPLHLGRMVMASGNILRLFFTPSGLKIMFEESSLSNGDVQLLKYESVAGFGTLPIKKE